MDLAEASVMLPPIRRVAAKSASAVRDWVKIPSVTFLDLSIYTSLEDSIATYVTSGTPVPIYEVAVWWANEA